MAELQQQMQAMMLQMQQLAAENKQLRAAQQNPQGAAPMQLEEEEEEAALSLETEQDEQQQQQQQRGEASRHGEAQRVGQLASQQEATRAAREVAEGKQQLAQLQPPGGPKPATVRGQGPPARAVSAGGSGVHGHQSERTVEQVRMAAVAPSKLTYITAATGTVLADWLFELEQLFSQLGVPEADFGERIVIAARYWDRQLNVWWKGHELQAQVGGTPVSTWAAFIGAINANFGSSGDAQAAMKELLSFRMKSGERMDAYLQRGALLLARAGALMSDTVAAHIAVEGVDVSRFPYTVAQVGGALQDQLGAGGRASFQWVRARLTAAAMKEPRGDSAAAKGASARGSSSGSSSGSNSTNASKSRNPPTAEQLRINALERQLRQLQSTAAASSGVGNTGRQTEGSSDEEGASSVAAVGEGSKGKGPLCFRCKQHGHVAAECGNKEQRSCYACGEQGHLRSKCPNRKEGQPKND
jgi:hypothetical protein